MNIAQLTSLSLFLLGGGLEVSSPADLPSGDFIEPAVDQACEIPIRWRIADVDPRFGISQDEAATAVRQAGMLWEAAVGRILMFQESADGIPVRFIYDERQVATQARQRQMESVAADVAAIEDSQSELEALESQLARRRIVHQARLSSFRDRLASHQEIVEYWNQRGGAPPDEVRRLRAVEEELEVARIAANEAAEEVNAAVEELNRATERINREIEDTNRVRTELSERFPPIRVQSGQYVESRTGLGRFTLSREVEIHIYQFEDRAHLLLVIAHELGHALGLEHTGVEGTLMAEAVVVSSNQGAPEIHPEDVEQLRALCPEL